MMRACFERALALWVWGPSADRWAGFAALTDNGDFAGDGFLADFDIEILHSALDGVAAAPPKPRIGDQAGGAGSRSALSAQVCRQYRSNRGRMPVLSAARYDPTQRPSTRDITRHEQVSMQPRCFYWQTANLFDPFAAAAGSPATKSSLSAACCATAAAIFQKILHILPPIVEGDFFFRLDSAHCYDYDPALAAHWFCIRPAGMIDVTRRVPSRRAVDGPSLVDLELISGAACLTPIGFFGGNAPAAIRRDIDPSLDWLCREQTEPSDRTTNPKGARGHRSRIAANFHNVTSNRRDVRVLLSEEIGDHCLRCVMRLEQRSRRR